MANSNGSKIRKGSLLGLGFKNQSLKAIASAVAALSLATGSAVVVSTQAGPFAEAQQVTAQVAGSTEETAIDATGTYGVGSQRYDGLAFSSLWGGLSDGVGANVTYIPGVKVYLQWVNGRGFVSPIYYTISDSEGKYSFDLSKPVKDATGTEHEFRLAGDSDFKVRTWAENPDPERLTIVKGGDYWNGRFHTRVQRKNEGWNFTAGINRIVNSQVVFMEKPNYKGWLAKPEGEWDVAPTPDGVWPDTGSNGALRGNVWWENKESGGTLANQYFFEKGNGDRAATGVKVAASYVNDEVARRFKAWEKANGNFTIEQAKQAQEEIVTEYQAEHGPGSHIAETVVGTVKSDGSYYLPFQGLWGRSYSERGVVSAEKYGQLTGERNNRQAFIWNGGISGEKRHINSEYMYVFPLIEDDHEVWMHAFQDNRFQTPNDGVGNENGSYEIVNQQFAILASNPLHRVTNFDVATKIAKAGDVAKTATTGLVPFNSYVVQWYTNGELVSGATCKLNANAQGALDSCDFKVPNTLDKPTVYSSEVFVANEDGSPSGELLLAANFLADPTYAEYPQVDGVVGLKDLEAVPQFDNPGTDAKETIPGGAKFAFENPAAAAALGLTIDSATGKITWPKDQQKLGSQFLPVRMTYQRTQGTEPVAKILNATFNLKTALASGLEPVYKDGEGTAGGKIVVPAPTFDDPGTEGVVEDTAAPEGTKFALGEGAPEGVGVDPDTGEVTVTVLEGAEVGSTIEVPIVVTYPDGSTDKTTTTITVNETPSVSIGDATVIEGWEIEPLKVESVVPRGGSVAVDGLPGGLSLDEAKGEITGTPEVVADWGPSEEERKFTVDVSVKNAEGETVASDEAVITVERDTDGDGVPDVRDADDDGDGVLDAEEIEKGSDPKDANVIPALPLVPVTGIKPVEDQTVVEGEQIAPITIAAVDEDSSVEVRVPQGLVYDESSGEVTGVPGVDDWGRDEESREVEIAVEVTNANGAKKSETITVTVERDTDGDGVPDVRDADDDGDGVLDAEEIEKGSDPKDANSIPDTPEVGDQAVTPTAPTNNNPSIGATVDDPATCELAPFVTIAEVTGVKYTVTVDGKELTANENGEYVYDYGQTVVIKATAEAGYTLTGTTEWTYTAPKSAVCGDASAPDWTDEATTTPGAPVKIPNTGGDVEPGTTVNVIEGPGTAMIDPEIGEITVTPGEDAKPGDKIVVEVKDPQGEVIGTITIAIDDESDTGDSQVPGPSDSLFPIIGGSLIGGGIIGSLIGSSQGASPSVPGSSGNAGGDQGGNTGDHAGGDQGGNAGGDQGGNTGGHAGGDQGGNTGDHAGGDQGGNAGGDQAETRGGQLAVTGVSGVTIVLGASVLAMAIGGALLALRRRREN